MVEMGYFYLGYWSDELYIISQVNAYEDTSSNSYGDSKSRTLEKAIIYELQPKFMDVLDKQYDDYVFDTFRILPMEESDTYPPQEFTLEGKVTLRDGSYDVVQITFNTSSQGYKVSDISIQSQNKVAEPIVQ
ncbi:hypothetical protein [Candidatus Pristimantibacillus sp. PTI5]|uniref:hypothetical protein n=1 Tax=Candidatus Pristimantibacillus sp. PTI5 TaxID=3400422 RepID=UPI003B02AB21